MIWILSKTVIIYFVLIIIFRFLGKREVGELSIFDLVILLIIADIASIGVDNDKFFLSGILCLIVLALLQKIFSFCLLKISFLRAVFDGNPTIIIENGELNYKNMRKELYTVDDLVFQMHQEHIMELNEIRLAILETNGTLSIFKKNNHDDIVLPVIISGRIEKDNCKSLGISKNALNKLLKKHKLNLNKIIYATLIKGQFSYFYNDKKSKESLKEHTIKIRL